MKLLLERWQHGLTSTLGSLFANERFVCFVLEDVVREVDGVPVADWKVASKTAIPRGTYQVKFTFSNRFQRIMPQLMDVPGFEGIRIHTGNTDVDTCGCLIVGREFDGETVLHSKIAYDGLMEILHKAFAAGEEVTLEVT